MRLRLALLLVAIGTPALASELDPYDCFGGGRYQAMSEGKVCADWPDLPSGISCDIIRAHVARYGRVASLAWAIGQGYSRAQIREARKCLR